MLKIVYGKDIERHHELMSDVFRFRHRIFVEEKGWSDLANPLGEESDQFDDEHTVHQILLHDDEIIGYQRLIPTIRPHLLTSVLSHLCADPTPCGPSVYEWTRFCLEPARRETFPRRNGAFLLLAQGVVEWGLANRVRTATVVIDARLVVIGMQLRFKIKPLGFPKRLGREDVVALEMGFNEETLATIHAARGTDASIISPDELHHRKFEHA